MTLFPVASAPPALNIPPSDVTVKVSVIDTTSRVKGPPATMFFAPLIKGFETLDCPAFSFLIEHEPSGKKVLFDLGVAKHWKDGPPVIVNPVVKGGFEVTVEKHVSEILTEHNVSLESIDTIIWSHWHWDHTGDPSTFPSTTSLTVGPGFTQAMTPGYPTNPEAPILESAYKGRDLVEISFDKTPLKLGRFNAFDYFGDGSFYLLDSPGHAVGHICGLARTTPDTFVFMGGDICHHGGEMRPTEYLPLPEHISPNPLKPKGQPCPGSLFLDIHPEHSATKRFYHVAEQGASSDPPEAERSIEKLEEFDGHENVFTVIAHDDTLTDIVDFFPKSLNDWKARGYREQAMWEFLRDFKDAVQAD
ncbi:putative N-acyl homoserine lactonase AttM [Ceratobasidium sp. AG-I]|nr:putative N-acyl homoserine lactonase AttM [Ceratobasidium sp. AG-I]